LQKEKKENAMICAPSPPDMIMNSMNTAAAATTPPRSSSSFRCQREDDEQKPFFLMDWLEEFISPDQDVYQLAALLQTPGKLNEMSSTPRRCSSPPNTPKSSNRKTKTAAFYNEKSSSSCSRKSLTVKPQQLFKDQGTTQNTPTKKNKKKNASSSHTSSKGGGSLNKQHSLLALGNGWNAKGLKKAREGLWKDALACWDVALELRLPLLPPTSEEVANTWNNRGIALGKLGDYLQALESLNKALEIRLHNNNNSNNDDNGNGSTKKKTTSVIISTYHNIANVHQQAGDYNKALAIFGIAKALCYEGGDAKDYPSMVSMARLCTAMGHVYYQAEQWVDARDAYYDAVWVYQQIVVVAEHKHHHAELKELRKDIREIDQKIILQQEKQAQQENEEAVRVVL
jgi:tetratricopeptide (TPR) repeat protein